MNFDTRPQIQVDADRYRFLRDEETNTDPFYYPFWQAFDPKLCRAEKMDALIDEWMVKRMVKRWKRAKETASG
jgi:hypothetical protein